MQESYHKHTDHPMKNEPVGTNLFDYTQAEQMVCYMLEGEASSPAAPADSAEDLAREIEDAIDRYERGPNRAESYFTFRSDRCGVIAALLRSRMGER